MAKVRLASGLEFDSELDVPILDAAEKHGARLEYSCRTGRCSSCKARVSVGTTVALHTETGLEQGESAAGWVLTCVRSAATDVAFAEDNELEFDLPRPTIQALRLNSIDRPSDDVAVVRFRLAPSARWGHVPGQHIEIIGTGGVRRAYSIANAPTKDGVLEMHIKNLPGGVLSDYWFGSAERNDLLRLRGPLGTFVLRQSERPMVFLATGTGVAPVKAMLEHLVRADSTRPVRVYVGARGPEDLYWLPTWGRANWVVVPVLSRADHTWAGRRGYVQQALLADLADLTDVDVYACGSEQMIHDARRVLTGTGLDPRRFFAEAFVESAPVEEGA